MVSSPHDVESEVWVTLSHREYEALQGRLTHAERYLRDHPALVQEFDDLRQRLQSAERERDAAFAEARRLRALIETATTPSRIILQSQLIGRLVDLLFERFTPIGVNIQLQRCRVCDLISVDRAIPSILDHYQLCPGRRILHEWNEAGTAGRDTDGAQTPQAG